MHDNDLCTSIYTLPVNFFLSCSVASLDRTGKLPGSSENRRCNNFKHDNLIMKISAWVVNLLLKTFIKTQKLDQDMQEVCLDHLIAYFPDGTDVNCHLSCATCHS